MAGENAKGGLLSSAVGCARVLAVYIDSRRVSNRKKWERRFAYGTTNREIGCVTTLCASSRRRSLSLGPCSRPWSLLNFTRRLCYVHVSHRTLLSHLCDDQRCIRAFRDRRDDQTRDTGYFEYCKRRKTLKVKDKTVSRVLNLHVITILYFICIYILNMI